MKLETALPLALIALAVGAAAFATYSSNGRGGWVVAYYPHIASPAFASAVPFADAIADDHPHSVTLLLHGEAQRLALRSSGALLLDPQGVPLCARN